MEADLEVIGTLPVEERLFADFNVHVASLRAIKCEGDSMEPKIHDGELVIFDTDRTDLRHGDVAIVEWCGRWIVRGVLTDDPKMVVLRALNREFADISVSAGDKRLRVRGAVVYVHPEPRRLSGIL